jgi:hypothetical protein
MLLLLLLLKVALLLALVHTISFAAADASSGFDSALD